MFFAFSFRTLITRTQNVNIKNLYDIMNDKTHLIKKNIEDNCSLNT